MPIFKRDFQKIFFPEKDDERDSIAYTMEPGGANLGPFIKNEIDLSYLADNDDNFYQSYEHRKSVLWIKVKDPLKLEVSMKSNVMLNELQERETQLYNIYKQHENTINEFVQLCSIVSEYQTRNKQYA